jgi:hypothetical protein
VKIWDGKEVHRSMPSASTPVTIHRAPASEGKLPAGSANFLNKLGIDLQSLELEQRVTSYLLSIPTMADLPYFLDQGNPHPDFVQIPILPSIPPPYNTKSDLR